VGALRVHPHKYDANFPSQEDRGFARGGCDIGKRCGVMMTDLNRNHQLERVEKSESGNSANARFAQAGNTN